MRILRVSVLLLALPLLLAVLLAACQSNAPARAPVEAKIETHPAPKQNGESEITVTLSNMDEAALSAADVSIVIEKKDGGGEEFIPLVRDAQTGKYGTRKTWTEAGPHRIFLHVLTPEDHLVFVEEVTVAP